MFSIILDLLLKPLTDKGVWILGGHHGVDLPADVRTDPPLSPEDVVGPPHLNVGQQLLALLERMTALIGGEESEGTGVLRHYGRHLLQSGQWRDSHQDLLPVLGQVLDVYTVLAASLGPVGEPGRAGDPLLEFERSLGHRPGLVEHGTAQISPSFTGSLVKEIVIRHSVHGQADDGLRGPWSGGTRHS